MLLFYLNLPRTGTSLSACSGTWPARSRRMLSTKRSDTARRRISLRPAAPPYGASAIRWADPAAGCPAAAAPARTHPGRRRRCGGSARPAWYRRRCPHCRSRRRSGPSPAAAPGPKRHRPPGCAPGSPRPHPAAVPRPPPRSPQKPSSPPESSRRSAPWSPPETCRSQPLSRAVIPFPAYSTGSFPGAQGSPGRTGAVGREKFFPDPMQPAYCFGC